MELKRTGKRLLLLQDGSVADESADAGNGLIGAPIVQIARVGVDVFAAAVAVCVSVFFFFLLAGGGRDKLSND